MTGVRDERIGLDQVSLVSMAERFASLAVKATGRGPLSHDEVLAEMDLPVCRWCRAPVIRGTPCGCARAQEEARRIRGAS